MRKMTKKEREMFDKINGYQKLILDGREGCEFEDLDNDTQERLGVIADIKCILFAGCVEYEEEP